MSVNEFYKIDLSDGTAAQLLDICRRSSCNNAVIRCVASIDTPAPAEADGTQANALLAIQADLFRSHASDAGWKVTDTQIAADADGHKCLRTVFMPAGLPLAVLPEVPQEAQVRLDEAVRKVISGEPDPCKFDGNAVSIHAFGKDISKLNDQYADLDEAISSSGWRVIEAHINLIPAGDVNTLRVTAIYQPGKEES